MDNKEKATTGRQKNHDKDNYFATQYKIVYQSFLEQPKTMLQASIETGILRANICRYVADMEDKGLVQMIRKGLCPYTHFRAGFYSTDEALFTEADVRQLYLFDNGI
jgi:hypothetical protein